jgi:hypothetical protein
MVNSRATAFTFLPGKCRKKVDAVALLYTLQKSPKKT